MRVGFGIDIHPLAVGRKLILGGIEIPFEKGIFGHSDGDALVHAIVDALLGAMGEGDIGEHFPDTDPKWKGCSSFKFLEKCKTLLMQKTLKINNIDSTILLEKPKVSLYKKQMAKNIADVLEIDSSLVNVKATREEGLGYIGQGNGIAAYAVVSLISIL